jgi:hypothetical protein
MHLREMLFQSQEGCRAFTIDLCLMGKGRGRGGQGFFSSIHGCQCGYIAHV